MFHTADGGETWEPRNRGTRADFLPEGQNYPEFGQCVHNLVMAPAMPDRLYQQNHCGMYRSDDGGRQLAEHRERPAVELRLPGRGPSARSRHRLPDPAQRRLRRAAMCRTPRPRSGARATPARAGRTCANGLPQQNAYFGVLRQAMATDRLEPAGIYFGTSTGTLFASADEGDSWAPIAEHLPIDLLGRDAGRREVTADAKRRRVKRERPTGDDAP